MTSYLQGTNATLLVQWYEFSGGPAVDVTAQTITITRISDATVVVGPTAVGITHIALGLYSYEWAVSSSEVIGDYAVIWNATDAAMQSVQTSEVVTVAARGTVASGPCNWSLDIDETCCPSWATLPVAQQTRAITYATKIMWAATGRRYGLCENVIRPCGLDRRCGSCGSWNWYGGWMRPYILDGLWRNCGCECACDCKPRCQIKLPSPVAQVTEVLVDGIIVADTLWRVDDNQWLVRTDGNCWPECQNYNVDVPAVGTIQVTYDRGDPIPQDVLDAAATLACEFAKACAGLPCRLPNRMTSLTRQGVSVSFVDIDRLLARGLTGIVEVDQVIIANNPFGQKSRPFFYSYDTAVRARTVTQG